ncbi:GTPase-activating Rap/Ran-GAP domain-like protein 3 isoform X1 [Cydia strobilella]|uniref:GTPase-activating Rap/Ran-GAP domain-like protein 3 isoform X1 n=1 Tax=Cydia strobilella TaxID=1100964 RepID=UPI0030076760
MLCLESIMARWRERGERREMEESRRLRSLSLCSAEGSLFQLLHRRASSAIRMRPPLESTCSSASELITRRGVFSRRQYGSVEQVSNLAGPSDGPDSYVRRYRLENGNSLGEKDELFGPHNTPVLENPEFQTRWYFKYFLGKMHQNYVGLDYAREPFLLSVVQESSAGLMRAILFNKNGAQKIYIPPSAWNTDPKTEVRTRPTVKQILAQFPCMERVDKLPREVSREISCAEVQKDVLLLEEQEGSVNFKIGVMFMRPGQRTDDEMLSNEFGDVAFDRFIELLGDRIRLKGWNRFRGGLDVKGDMTGLHSVYTMHHGHEIMFHVSTLLPHSKDNKQQLERKRHIGNDIVNIIFVDERAHETFNPQFIKSHFTHIFAVVSEIPEGYKLSIFSDDCVPPFGPSLPCPPIFVDPNLFRDYLLVKMMNGEKSAFQTPIFTQKRQRTLDTLIKDIYTEHCTDHKVPMLSRRALSDVWSGNSQSAGAARTERFLHIGQAIKLDAVLRGDAPTSLASSGQVQRSGRRAPWEGRVWRSTPLPGAPVCAEQISEGKLLLSTNNNTYILEDSGTTRVILRWEGSVRAVRLTERAGLFRVGARANGVSSASSNASSAGVYAVPLAQLYAGAWAMRPLQDCKQARLSRTKTAHFFDLVEHRGRITLVVSVSRRVLIMAEEERLDNDKGFDYVHIKDVMLGEVPSLIKYLNYDSGVIVAGYKHHWEVVDCGSGQCVKRADNAEQRRGTLVNALRIGDERDRQIVLCYNHTCHFERLTNRGLESEAEYDFHWTSVPLAVVNAFPYIMAFAEDLLEIRLVANGSLVHAACIPGLKLLCGQRDIFYVACAPEYVPLNDDDEANLGLPPESMEQIRQRQQPYSVDGDERSVPPCTSAAARAADAASASASSRSSSLSSEHDTIRPPLQRTARVSPPNSPQVSSSTSTEQPSTPLTSASTSRCVRVYKIPHGNLGAGAYARQSVSVDQPRPQGAAALLQAAALLPQGAQPQVAARAQVEPQPGPSGIQRLDYHRPSTSRAPTEPRPSTSRD